MFFMRSVPWYSVLHSLREEKLNVSCVCVSILKKRLKMPHTFTREEYADMLFVYGLCHGNALQAVNEYRDRYPN